MGLRAAQVATEGDRQECLRRIGADRIGIGGQPAVVSFPSRSSSRPCADAAFVCRLPVALPVTAHGFTSECVVANHTPSHAPQQFTIRTISS